MTLRSDLDDVLERNADDFATFRGARLFISGGTGFVGSWLLETLLYANERLALGARVVVLTRDPDGFVARRPHLANASGVVLESGEVARTPLRLGTFDAIVHAATPASASVNEETPLVMIETVVDGTRSVLELAGRSGAIPFLFTSSGAVYGRQPPALERVPETYTGGPDPLDPRNAYHESKRLAELLCATAVSESGVQAKIARLFAFVGPYLPVDRHFAIGNFVGDVLAGRDVEISGDGTPVRSYLYAADLATWLWRILARGAAGRAYNVGSESTIDIRATAAAVVAESDRSSAVVVRGVPITGRLPDRYVPATERARRELHLAESTPLDVAIRKTLAWHRR